MIYDGNNGELSPLLKVTKLSVTIVIFYILMYVQTWGDNHLLLYGASLLAVISMAVHWLLEGCIDFSYVPFGIWNNLIVIAYSLLVGVFVAYDYSALVGSCITYASFSVICIAICYISSEEKSFEWIFNVLIVVAIICALYMLTFGVTWKGYGRTLSEYNNPHAFAAVMNLGIFSTAYKFRKFDLQEFISSAVINTLLFYCIIECGSRKYLLTSLALVVIWAVTYGSNIWKNGDVNKRILVSTLFIAAIIIAIYIYRYYYRESLSYLRLFADNDAGNVNRMRFYKIAVDILRERPLLGGGYDQFQYWSGVGSYSHSTYAEAIADLGVIGSAIYFLPIIISFFSIARKALVEIKDYLSILMFAFCLAELFLGVGQIFFMEFYHFIAWTIIFYYDKHINPQGIDGQYLSLGVGKKSLPLKSSYIKSKYIR